MARRRNVPKIKLPSKFTPAQVRVNDKGQVQIRINPAKVGKGTAVRNVVKVARVTVKRAANAKRRNTRPKTKRTNRRTRRK